MLAAFFLTLRHKDSKARSFYEKQEACNYGEYFQPFELIEPYTKNTNFLLRERHEVEMLAAFFLTLRHKDSNARSFYEKQEACNYGEYFQPFELIERIEPFEPLKLYKPHKPLKPPKPLKPLI